MFISVGTWKRIFATIEISETPHIVGNGRDAYCQQYVFPGLLVTGLYVMYHYSAPNLDLLNSTIRTL